MWDNCSFVKDELEAFESYLKDKYKPRNRFLSDVSQKVISSGGKRLRPALVIISGMMGDYDRTKIFPAAAAIETLHTATLIHDDIIDNSKTRRGCPTVSEKHGINLAVYTGDYLLANSILLLSESGLSTDKLDRVAKAARAICTGEVNQYLSRNKLTSVSEYLRRVMRKTGILFSASCTLGAYASGCSEKHVNVMGRIGMNLGIAFQIRDDLIDIESDETQAGKTVANDIREGIITLPFLFAAKRCEKVRKKIEEVMNGGVEIKEIINDVLTIGGADDARRLKDRYIEKCRDLSVTLPGGNSTQALDEILCWL
ncbi:MAG TPA: polyprenyl synthetase family protein [Clostridiales bacterium]|nr:polyprenyl synthetase family protein [Clostridiales bacterium]